MKKLKGILGIVLALAMLCTAFVIPMSASAADVKTADTGSEPNLQNNIEDGCILQALCWSYKEIEKNIPQIAAAGYSTVQTSPVQQPKDYSPSTNISGQWWKFYQPVNLALAERSWVGTKADLTSLCNTAHQYGVKIICDVVTNHLGADDDLKYLQLAKDVKKYDTTLWNSTGKISGNPYFHQNGTGSTASDANAVSVTQKVSSGCPDLNTANSTVQNKVISLLTECVNCGVDGFRFDAAKHIETPADSGVGDTSYWTNIINGANAAASKKGKTLFYYGEVLNTPGGGRSIEGYTNLNGGKYRVTENVGSNAVRSAVKNGNASSAANLSYGVTKQAKSAVVWAESHDTYLNSDDGNYSAGISDENIVKTWALVAAHGVATPLFFARTNQAMKMGDHAVNTTYKSVAVSEVNKFHNKFAGKSEKTGSSGNFAYVARDNAGIVIVNVKGNASSVSISGTGLVNGTYTDKITGATFTVNNGTVSGNIGSTGVAVVTQDATTPYIFADQESQTFQGEYIVVNLTTQNATSATYQLENAAAHTFTGSKKIRIGKDYNYGDTINLTLTATNGSSTTTVKYQYVKKPASASGIYIVIPQSVLNSYNSSLSGSKKAWQAPFYCYVYDEPNGKGKFPVYQNSFWPGETLEYDETNQVYYAEIHSDSCVQVQNSNGDWVVSDYDLAHGSGTRVIVSDSAPVDDQGRSQGHQLPSDSGFLLGGVSKAFKTFKSETASVAWQNTTIKPGKVIDETGAVDVKKSDAPEPTTQAPTTQAPTTQAPTTAAPTTAAPSGFKYGDFNKSKAVDINDVTAIQLHLAKKAVVTDSVALALGDVDGDGRVSIKDANYIQRYLANFSNTLKVGQDYTGSTPTTPTNPTTPTTPTTPTEQPTTPTTPPPTGTYTLYLKTTLSWISSVGAEPFVYDNASGESYRMYKDTEAYPEVFTADVPLSVSDVTFYRATAASSPSEGYNVVENITVSSTDNCITLYEKEKVGVETVLGATVGPYVAEQKPADGVSTIYVESSWSEVYIYGWGKGLNQEAIKLDKVSGNIWKFDLPEKIYGDSDKFFLLKGSATGWDPKTEDLAITNNNDFFNTTSMTWSKYSG